MEVVALLDEHFIVNVGRVELGAAHVVTALNAVNQDLEAAADLRAVQLHRNAALDLHDLL